MYISDLTARFSSVSIDVRNQKQILGGFRVQSWTKLKDSLIQFEGSLPNSSGSSQFKIAISDDGNSVAVSSTSTSTFTVETISYPVIPQQ